MMRTLKSLPSRGMTGLKQLPATLLSLARENLGLLIGGAVIGIFILIVGYYVLVPSYLSPSTKFYASGLGYPAMMRRLDKPLPVMTSKVGEREFTRFVMGEGVCASDPVLVPIIPLASIVKVHFKEGDRVEQGQVMAELDDELARIKLASAKLAVSTAKAELARVESGSAYVLAQERPKMERINLTAENERFELAKQKVERFRTAFERGLVAKTALLDAEKEFATAQQSRQEALLRMSMAEQGVVKSLEIARNAVSDAEEAVAHRTLELENYTMRAPVGGIVERVLIKEGEYNSDPGKPGFVVVSGLWFDTFFDQADFLYVQPGQIGEIRLEAYPGVSMPAVVERINPVVSFNEGGPEISRPLRPRGSGAPEWAATFKSQLRFAEPDEKFPVAMGMTGFGRLTVKRTGVAIPRSALLSVSAGAGVVYLPGEENGWEARQVKIGIVDDQAAEVLSGLEPGEEIIVEG
ncbi:MAG: efflux RND transporter periplasmic adaptor subunit, partial [Verrucomicrobiota bacterium JB023]|nr:efflux RND transporter periplasmic adaptor subunit [Verrucomicrobiota bacterium JB023]